jgi:RHS repeat-associated protein
MIASRARSDPIPLPLGSIPGPASVLLFESMNQPVSSAGGVSIVSTVWAPPGGGYSRYGAGSSSYGPVGLKSGSGAQIGVTTTLASYEFDDENQLVSVTQGSDRRTTFVYDGKRRRRVTQEKTKGSSGQWVLASETRYVYDGMRVIQERNINGVPTVAYTRGPDLSGTLEGAGGIGGLLARSEWDGSAGSRHAFYHSDGVGNVTALAVPNGNAIALAGSYRYDPFGRLIGTPTGLAAINTQRYSSKDWHNPSGFYYFGYRFYDPATQRWLNRDPIGEEGGVNLYGYVGNDPIDLIDPFGLAEGDYKSTAINNALQSVGSTSTYGDLQPVKGTPYKFDPNMQKYLRFDLDASHKDPNIHFFDSLKDMKKNKTSCKVFVNAKTAAVKSLSFLGIGITMVGNLNTLADNPNYREALAAAKAGDKSGAENALYELSVDLSIESGSTAPLYIINSQIK